MQTAQHSHQNYSHFPPQTIRHRRPPAPHFLCNLYNLEYCLTPFLYKSHGASSHRQRSTHCTIKAAPRRNIPSAPHPFSKESLIQSSHHITAPHPSGKEALTPSSHRPVTEASPHPSITHRNSSKISGCCIIRVMGRR